MVILFDKYNLPENVIDIIFATNQQRIVAKLLIEYFKQKNGSLTRQEMSIFANSLHFGLKIESDLKWLKKDKPITYNKRQFYDRIVTPMKSMGIIRYDLFEKRYYLGGDFKKQLELIGEMLEQELKKESMGIKFKLLSPDEIRKLQTENSTQ